MDSAGVRLVTVEGAPEEAPSWGVVDPEPFLRLGTVEGPEHLTFGSVTDVRVLPDGGVAVADGQARAVRFFDPRGGYLRSVGGAGEGPGELGGPPEILGVRGDTLLLWTLRDQRVTRLGLEDGELRGTFSLRDSGGWIQAMALAGDGGLVALSGFGSGTVPEGQDVALARDTAVLRKLDSHGEEVDTLVTAPGGEMLRSVESASGTGGGTMVSVMSAPRPFGRDFLWAVGAGPAGSGGPAPTGAALWAGNNDRFELRRWSGEGELEVVVRWPDAERATVAGELLEGLEPGRRRVLESLMEDFPPPPVRPAFGALVVDDGGRLWVGPWSPVGPWAVGPSPAGESRARSEPWLVFEPSGALLGRVGLPPGLRVEAIAGDGVYGVTEDELGVAYVEAYRVRND